MQVIAEQRAAGQFQGGEQRVLGLMLAVRGEVGDRGVSRPARVAAGVRPRR